MFEYLNSPSTVAPVSFATCGGFAKSRSGDKTFAQQYAGTTDELREIVDEVRRYMVEQGDNVSENELKLYLAIKNVCNRLRRGEQDARDSAYTFGSRYCLSLIHISEPTRQAEISYAVFCLKKKKKKKKKK